MDEKKAMVNLTITKASLEVLDWLADKLPTKDGLPLSRGEAVDWLAQFGNSSMVMTKGLEQAFGEMKLAKKGEN